jgi:3-hydroxyacyl-CoA dehydrogenase
MNKIKPGLDIIMDVLKESLAAYPTSNFVESLLFQYQERGSLSKKQLEGLYQKATNVPSLSPGKLATLEAIILKKPNRYKSPMPVAATQLVKDDLLEKKVNDILSKYPQHKMVCFIKAKLDNNEAISTLEKSEIERLHKLLIK